MHRLVWLCIGLVIVHSFVIKPSPSPKSLSSKFAAQISAGKAIQGSYCAIKRSHLHKLCVIGTDDRFSDGSSLSDGVSLGGLINIHTDAKSLGLCITKWLDDEWIPQACHERIGNKVMETYVSLRNEGTTDLGEMLMGMGVALESFDLEDAFVNAWNIANKVSDLLISRLNTGSFEGDTVSTFFAMKVSEKVQVPAYAMGNEDNDGSLIDVPSLQLDCEKLAEFCEDYDGEFRRYCFLRDLAEGDVSWSDVAYVSAVCLGFRVVDGAITQVQNVSAAGWDSLAAVPDFTDLVDDSLRDRMKQDLPDDEESTDILMESVAGMETYKRFMKESEDVAVQRRVLLCKWLYTQGFLGDEFPRVTKFIPGHMQEEDDGFD